MIRCAHDREEAQDLSKHRCSSERDGTLVRICRGVKSDSVTRIRWTDHVEQRAARRQRTRARWLRPPDASRRSTRRAEFDPGSVSMPEVRPKGLTRLAREVPASVAGTSSTNCANCARRVKMRRPAGATKSHRRSASSERRRNRRDRRAKIPREKRTAVRATHHGLRDRGRITPAALLPGEGRRLLEVGRSPGEAALSTALAYRPDRMAARHDRQRSARQVAHSQARRRSLPAIILLHATQRGLRADHVERISEECPERAEPGRRE